MTNELDLAPRKPTIVIASSRHWDRPLIEQVADSTGAFIHWIGSPEELTVDRLRLVGPRYVFFAHWSHLIPPDIYETMECVIFHMTDLPFGRGGSPLQNLIARGIYETKISALRCTHGLDTGPIYAKRPLSLHGNAEEIFLRARGIIGDMIVDILRTEPTPIEQSGEPTRFLRRKPADGSIGELTSLDRVFDWIRMLDAQGYPPAFLEAGHLRLEFSRASRTHEAIVADVRITLRDADQNGDA